VLVELRGLRGVIASKKRRTGEKISNMARKRRNRRIPIFDKERSQDGNVQGPTLGAVPTDRKVPKKGRGCDTTAEERHGHKFFKNATTLTKKTDGKHPYSTNSTKLSQLITV